MSWSDEVDLAFARRREELLAELLRDGAQVIDELGALASACAAEHPLVYVGSGVGIGACMTGLRGRSTADVPRRRSRLVRGVLATLRGPLMALRAWPMASLFTG